MPVNAATGEPQNTAGWSQDDPAASAGTSPLALTLGKQTQQYGGKMDALTADMESQYKQQQEAEAPYRDKLLKILESPNAAHAHLQQVKDAPKPEDYQKYSMEYASAMALIGAIGSRWTRNAGNASLNAFAGALKGWKEGNLQAYESAAKEWEHNTKKTLENNQIEMQKYKEIMDDKKLNIDQMMAAMNLVSSQFQNKIMFDATVAKNYTMAFGAVDKMDAIQARLQTATDKLNDVRNNQKEQVKSQVEYLNAHPEQIAHMNMKDYLKLKGAADTLGYPLEPHPESFQTSQPRSAPGMALQKFIQENPHATSEQITQFASTYTGAQSGARTEATRAANLDIILNSAKAAVPQALEASDAVPRGNWVPVNKAIQSYQAGQSDPKLAAFAVSNLQLAELWARAMNPTGVMRASDRELALANLSTATSPETYRVVVNQILQAINREKGAVSETEAERRGGGGAVQAPVPTGAGSGAGNEGWGDLKVH